jgi:hypothetical protein
MYPKKEERPKPMGPKRNVLCNPSHGTGEQKKYYGDDWKQPEYKETVEQKRLEHNGARIQGILKWDSGNPRLLYLTKQDQSDLFQPSCIPGKKTKRIRKGFRSVCYYLT